MPDGFGGLVTPLGIFWCEPDMSGNCSCAGLLSRLAPDLLSTCPAVSFEYHQWQSHHLRFNCLYQPMLPDWFDLKYTRGKLSELWALVYPAWLKYNSIRKLGMRRYLNLCNPPSIDLYLPVNQRITMFEKYCRPSWEKLVETMAQMPGYVEAK